MPEIREMAAMVTAHAAAPQHILLLRLRDRPGAIERVVGLLRRRASASAIATFSAAPTEEPDVLRVTIGLREARGGADQLVTQLRKVEDVQSAVAIAADGMEREAVARELALIRVAYDGAPARREIVDLAQLFAAQAVDVSEHAITLEVSGTSETIESLLTLLRPLGVRDVARTGKVVMRHEEDEPAAGEAAVRRGMQATG